MSNSRLSLKTKSWLCFTPVTRTTTPHQNLSVGSILEGWNLTHRLLRGFWLSLGGMGPSHKKNKNNKNFWTQNFFRPKICFAQKTFRTKIFVYQHFLLIQNSLRYKILFKPKTNFEPKILFKIFFDQKFYRTHNFFWLKSFLDTKFLLA